MTELLIGGKVKVSYANKGGFPYVLHVEVLETAENNQFIGRVESIFARGSGEVTGGNILGLKGQKMTFSADDLIVET